MNISELINKKRETRRVEVQQNQTEDLNKPLILALFGIDVYGKDATKDEIIQLIIGKIPTPYEQLTQALETIYDRELAAGNIVKNKKGVFHKDGRIILVPHTR